MLAALINVPAGIGYPLLFVLVASEFRPALVPGEAPVSCPDEDNCPHARAKPEAVSASTPLTNAARRRGET
jgi:hypothetical protein